MHSTLLTNLQPYFSLISAALSVATLGFVINLARLMHEVNAERAEVIKERAEVVKEGEGHGYGGSNCSAWFHGS